MEIPRKVLAEVGKLSWIRSLIPAVPITDRSQFGARRIIPKQSLRNCVYTRIPKDSLETSLSVQSLLLIKSEARVGDFVGSR